MRLQVTITSQKFDNPSLQFVQARELVDYTLAEITASGDSCLLAGHLRALADSIDPTIASIPMHEDGH